MIFMKFDSAGTAAVDPGARRAARVRPAALGHASAPNNDLLITTDNGAGDAILRVSPR